MKIAEYLFSAAIIFLTVSSSSAKIAQNFSGLKENRNIVFAAQTATPETLLKDLYTVHGQDFKNEKDRILNGENRTYLDKYFDKNLADLIWKDLTTQRDGVGVIDFDLFYNAQDADVKSFTVGKAKIAGETARVPVSFVNYTNKETVTYSLKKQNGAWKISDINYGNKDSLLAYFAEDAKNNAAYKNFEGTFQVGNTICAVKPVENGFELRWTKGAGAMTFYFQGNEDGKYVFSSEDNGKGQDKFIFDDESLNTGKFVRADAKEMPVKKVK